MTATSRRLARYEALLNDIMPHVPPNVKMMIEEAREQVSPRHFATFLSHLQQSAGCSSLNVWPVRIRGTQRSRSIDIHRARRPRKLFFELASQSTPSRANASVHPSRAATAASATTGPALRIHVTCVRGCKHSSWLRRFPRRASNTSTFDHSTRNAD